MFPAITSPAAYTFEEGWPSDISTRVCVSTLRPRYVNVMPGRSGYAQYGGVSRRWAQLVFSGVRPLVRQPSSALRLGVPCCAAWLKVSIVASRAPDGSARTRASSPIEFATIGGNTDGMNVPALFASTIEYAICPGCRAISFPQIAYRF